MIIAQSVFTLLSGIIKQAQDIASEARWMEFYAHGPQTQDQIEMIEDTVFQIENALVAIRANITDLKSEDL